MAFARFVRRAIDDARDERGWTVTDLASHTGVGRSTVFRWLAGDWQDYPELAKVRGFCAALDVPVAAAFRALGLPDAGPGTAADATTTARSRPTSGSSWTGWPTRRSPPRRSSTSATCSATWPAAPSAGPADARRAARVRRTGQR